MHVMHLTGNLVRLVRALKIAPKWLSGFIWLLGQAVKTPPFHGGNRGSIPLGVTKFLCNWINFSRIYPVHIYVEYKDSFI